jgi:NAD(P)-dependent dehydrogenase (short-subunit alcohol dehydrogenase family)
MSSSIADRHVLVIGGRSGIGAAVARAAAAEGARVTIAGRRAERLLEVAAELGPGAQTIQLDVSDPEAVRAALDQVTEERALDHLVVTANVPAGGPFTELEPETVRRGVDVKLLGQIWAARYAAPHFGAGGSITLFSGVAAWRPSPGSAVTATINGAIAALGRALALELAPIRVNVISPGIVDSDAWAGMPDDEREAFLKGAGDALPVGRVGRPEEIASTVLHAMHNGFLTGSVLHVDGGGRIRG